MERLRFLLTHSPSSINARCPSSGDTPLILAARAGHKEVVHLLLKLGTDVTAQNDADENALEVASDEMKKIILCMWIPNSSHPPPTSLPIPLVFITCDTSLFPLPFSSHPPSFPSHLITCDLPIASIEHEDRAMTTAQALLQSAWLGDAVSVKKSLEVRESALSNILNYMVIYSQGKVISTLIVGIVMA